MQMKLIPEEVRNYYYNAVTREMAQRFIFVATADFFEDNKEVFEDNKEISDHFEWNCPKKFISSLKDIGSVLLLYGVKRIVIEKAVEIGKRFKEPDREKEALDGIDLILHFVCVCALYEDLKSGKDVPSNKTEKDFFDFLCTNPCEVERKEDLDGKSLEIYNSLVEAFTKAFRPMTEIFMDEIIRGIKESEESDL